jgi:hypothetical protein
VEPWRKGGVEHHCDSEYQGDDTQCPTKSRAPRQDLFPDHDRSEEDHGDEIHQTERNEKSHQSPATGEAEGSVVDASP